MPAIGDRFEMRTVAEAAPPCSRLRILFLIDEMEAITDGGTERQILQLVQLALRSGYQPCVAVLRGTKWLTQEKAGCPVYLGEARSLLRPSGWREIARLVRWMREYRFTILQSFFPESNIIGPWLARFTGVEFVIGSRRNLNQWQERPNWIRPVFRIFQRLANRRTHCILANSQVVAEAIARVEGVSDAKLRVAYNGIDLDKFSRIGDCRTHMRAMLGIAKDEILIGNVSCMRPVKGLDQFVEAARLALEKDPKLRFIIVGDGSEKSAIAEQIRRDGLQGRIHLAGAQEDVLPYLAAMDIGVLSSLAEGFSNSLLEYMATGLAIVATEVGGNREALEGAGILVPQADAQSLADAILRLRATDVRRQLGQAARQRVESFSTERAEKRMEELYSEMLAMRENSRSRS